MRTRIHRQARTNIIRLTPSRSCKINSMPYNLRRTKAPKLNGLSLRVATALMENRFSRPLLMPGLLKNAGMQEFRKLTPNVPPTMFPLVEPTATTYQEADRVPVANAVAADVSPSASADFQHCSVVDSARAYQQQSTSPENFARPRTSDHFHFVKEKESKSPLSTAY
jgi:hypothetical protein